MAMILDSGDYNDFDPATLVPGQAAVFSENDPTAPDGKGLNVAFDKGNVKRLLTYDDLASLGVWSQHFCATGEYDATSGKPTISNPSTSCIYFVPVGDGVWTKWIYQGGSWVKIGSTDDVTLVTTGMIEDGAVTDAKLSQPLRDFIYRVSTIGQTKAELNTDANANYLEIKGIDGSGGRLMLTTNSNGLYLRKLQDDGSWVLVWQMKPSS